MKALVKAVPAGKEAVYTTVPEENKYKMKALLEEFGSEVEIYSYPVALEALPEKVQEEVKSVLKAYSEVSVTYERNQFKVSAGIGIYSAYACDHMVCGRYKQEEVYTVEERRRRNFKEEFGYEPCYL